MWLVGALTRRPQFGFFDKTVGEDVMLVDEVQFQNLFEMYKSDALPSPLSCGG